MEQVRKTLGWNSFGFVAIVFVVLSGCAPVQRNYAPPPRNIQPVSEEPKFENAIPDSDTFIPYEIAPQPIVNPHAEYPEKAKKDGASGKVTVKIYVDEKGEVRKWEIIKATPPGLGFEEEAIKAVQKWKFAPAVQRGKPVGVWIAIPFTFEIK